MMVCVCGGGECTIFISIKCSLNRKRLYRSTRKALKHTCEHNPKFLSVLVVLEWIQVQYSYFVLQLFWFRFLFIFCTIKLLLRFLSSSYNSTNEKLHTLPSRAPMFSALKKERTHTFQGVLPLEPTWFTLPFPRFPWCAAKAWRVYSCVNRLLCSMNQWWCHREARGHFPKKMFSFLQFAPKIISNVLKLVQIWQFRH